VVHCPDPVIARCRIILIIRMPVQRYAEVIRTRKDRTMQLPRPIQTYFTARAPQDGDMLVAAFAPDAIVHDEGRDHLGSQAIRDWWVAAKAKYRHHAEPIDVVHTPRETVVRAVVTGDFPGSPAVLTFTFGLVGDLISDLRIG
jgi:hypothetical protein